MTAVDITVGIGILESRNQLNVLRITVVSIVDLVSIINTYADSATTLLLLRKITQNIIILRV